MENITQGIWHAHDGQIYPQETGKTLALIPYWDKDNKEMQANAQLIAKAPELLKILKELLSLSINLTNHYHREFIEAKALINELNQLQ